MTAAIRYLPASILEGLSLTIRDITVCIEHLIDGQSRQQACGAHPRSLLRYQTDVT